MAETNDCTKGMGVSRNNCFGIMTWERGYREGKTYATKEESYADFKDLWTRKYKGFPNGQAATAWTGNDSPGTWLYAVNKYYNT